MDRARSSASAPLLVVAVIAALLVAYGAAFYLCGKVGTGGGVRFHGYRWQWMATFFTPAATVESWVLQQEVYTFGPEEL
jgi:hypothetical protein